MELKKETWTSKDINEFQAYLKTLGNLDEKKIAWSKNLLKTDMPVLVISTPDIKRIAKEIGEGNYLSFLDHMVWDYYENTAINGFLISKIKDFDLMKKYLDIYSSRADNWATCDLLVLQIEGNEDKYMNLAYEYKKSDKPFVRRIGMEALFKLMDEEKYVDEILEFLNSFYEEEDYYVNMMNAWLLCDLFIKRRNQTLKLLKKHKLNKFTINKMISKCRDSYRVSEEDKEMLIKYRVK